MPEHEKLIINRKNWLRGEGTGKSFLYRPDDEKMCCLGFYAVMIGSDKEEIKNMKSPHSVKEETIKKFPEWLVNNHLGYGASCTDICTDLVIINDTNLVEYSDSERERKITEIFKKNNVEVEFVD